MLNDEAKRLSVFAASADESIRRAAQRYQAQQAAKPNPQPTPQPIPNEEKPPPHLLEDVCEALRSLGMKKAEAFRIATLAWNETKETDVSKLLREALKRQ